MKVGHLLGLSILAGCAPHRQPLPMPGGAVPAQPAYNTGLSSRLAAATTGLEMRSRLKTRTPVLTYHDIISKRGKASAWFDCTEAEFVAQLKWLKAQGAVFISVDQLFHHLTTNAGIPRRSVVITFADNYLGFYTRAIPILKRMKIPATMFIHTGFVGSKVGRPKLSWDQLADVARDPLFTIGSQTVTHPANLPKMLPAQIRDEVTISRQVIVGKLHRPTAYLAYPNGKFDETCMEQAKVAGYSMAFTEQWVPAELSPSIFAIGRYVHTQYRRAWRDAYEKPKE